MLFLPVRPCYASKIVAGEKTIELRRRLPLRCSIGDQIAFYATSPKCELAAVARVKGVLRGAKAELWQKVKTGAGVDRSVFMSYFEGVDSGYGIEIGDTRPFSSPVGLDLLREEWPEFRPPQGFCYLDDRQSAAVIGWLGRSPECRAA